MVNYSQQGKRSKRKGNKYELRCAKLLKEFTNTNFRRVPMSGGFNKLGSIVRSELFRGDLICDDPKFQYCIEAKNRKSFSFVALLKNPRTAAFTKWWEQCVGDARANGLAPIMFFKPDNQADFIALSNDDPNFKFTDQIPHFKLNLYDSFEDINLPDPIIVDWKILVKNFKPGLLFKD